jgi:hypothetical protein
VTTFKIIRVYEGGEIVAECEGDERLRGFWWSWYPRAVPDEIGVGGATAVEFAAIPLAEDQRDLTPETLVQLLTEHYRDPAHVDELIGLWSRASATCPASSTS